MSDKMRESDGDVIALMRSLLSYDSESGILTYKERSRDYFATGRACTVWNSRFAGTAVGCDKGGYLYFNLRKKAHSVARACWIVHHGEIPDTIDHIDGNTKNNAISNLRNVEFKDNAKNLKTYSNNKSGCAGVYWHKSIGKWTASIRASGKLNAIISTNDFFEAVCARKSAERSLGFHENHARR